jgi:hypothetical protein
MPPKIQTVIGIPGAWGERRDIVVNIAGDDQGYIFAGFILMNTATKKSWKVQLCEPDPAVPRAFAVAGRQSLSSTDQDAIARHTFMMYVIDDNGGTPEAAKETLDATACILRAGGLAVNVESTGKAHSVKDWTTLAGSESRAALYHAFVTLIGDTHCAYSCGMHNLGLPDVVISQAPTKQTAILAETFLLYTFMENPDLGSGHTFSVNPDAPRYRLSRENCHLYPKDDIMHNPFGMWRLEPV